MQVGHLPIKAGWQDVPLASRSFGEALKNNIFLDSLWLLFYGFWKVKAQPLVQEEKHLFFLVKMLRPLGIIFIIQFFARACISA